MDETNGRMPCFTFKAAMTQEDFISEIHKLFRMIPRAKREVHVPKKLLITEIQKLYERIDAMESVVRQIRGTMDVFLEHKKLYFETEQNCLVFMELVHKWDSEIGELRGIKRNVA